MMNPEIKQKWIDALATATYKQGKGCLRNQKDEFCGLGVLCDIYSKETGVEWTPSDKDIEGVIEDGMEIEGRMATLPKEIMEWAGLESFNPVVNIESLGMCPLTHVNDSLNYTFPQIAELIQEQL